MMTLERILYEVFGDMPAFRMQKCQVVYQIARICDVRGGFVDLGTWLGYSAIAMTIGAQENTYQPRHVFTIDAYVDLNGWAGEHYGPADKEAFFVNRAKASTLLTKEGKPALRCFLQTFDVLAAAKQWCAPIAFLHWDLGCDNRLEKDVAAWWPHLVPGGTIAIHDTMQSRFGADALLEQYKEDGKVWEHRQLPAGMWVAVKRGG